jgi:hypothetical protein
MANLWAERFTAEERLMAEQTVLPYHALREVCAAAPHGKVPAIAERLAVDLGREATRCQLATALRRDAAEAEKQGARAEPASTVTSCAPAVAATRAKSSGRRAR